MNECFEKFGFNIELLFFIDMLNIWVCKGNILLYFCFVGYIDVVLIGFEKNW